MQRISNLIAYFILSINLLGAEPMNEFNEHNFSISYPANVELIVSDNGMDFVIYTFTLENDNLIKMYVGNAPAFHNKYDKQSIIIDVFNGFQVRKIRSTDNTTNTSKEEGIIHIRSSKLPDNFQEMFDLAEDKELFFNQFFANRIGWPEYIHYWYSDKSNVEIELIYTILNSITI